MKCLKYLSLAMGCVLASPLFGKVSQASLNGPWTFTLDQDPAITVTVPHTWNAVDGVEGKNPKRRGNALSVQSNEYRRGTGVYTRTFHVSSLGKRLYVRGEGASQVSTISINGQVVGKHEGAFTAFCYDISHAIKVGDNQISVSVDNRYNDNIVPLSGDFTLFGGLYRNISLISDDAKLDDAYMPMDFFASPGYWLNYEGDGVLSVEALVVDPKKEVVNFSIATANRTFKGSGECVRVPAGEHPRFAAIAKALPDHPDVKRYLGNPNAWVLRQQFKVSPLHEWSLEKPVLHQFKVTFKGRDGKSIKQMSRKIMYGLRTFKITDQGFIINREQPITLHGVNRHQDVMGKGWALSYEDELRDMEMIREMGANGLRTAHYPQSSTIYDYCDEHGIAVWSEITCIEKVRDRPEFIANAKVQATEMILQLSNHPSVVVWGLYNEIYHQTSAADRKHNMVKVLTEINDHMVAISDRPIIGNSNQNDRKLHDITEVLGKNSYPGWYGGGPAGMKGAIAGLLGNRKAGQPVAVGEYGHGADIADHQIPAKQPRPVSPWHPEEWQAYAHQINYRHIKAEPRLWGTFIWAMFDFASVERHEGARAGVNDKGLVTGDRQVRKDAFYLYKANWNKAPMVHLESKRFDKRPVGKTTVRAYSNQPQVSLTINGHTFAPQKPNGECVATWTDVPLIKGKNKLIVRAGNCIDQMEITAE